MTVQTDFDKKIKVKCSGSCGREFDIIIRVAINEHNRFERPKKICVLENPKVICQECIDHNNNVEEKIDLRTPITTR